MEAWLALYHRRPLIIACPEANAPRDARYQMIDEQREQQQQHLERLAAYERYPLKFSSADRLTVEILRSKLPDLLARIEPSPKLINLTLPTISTLLKGRDSLLENLQHSLGRIPTSTNTPVIARVLNGLGGVGKTRLELSLLNGHIMV